MLARRGFLAGLFAAPAIIKTPGLLMPVKSVFEEFVALEIPIIYGKTIIDGSRILAGSILASQLSLEHCDPKIVQEIQAGKWFFNASPVSELFDCD